MVWQIGLCNQKRAKVIAGAKKTYSSIYFDYKNPNLSWKIPTFLADSSGSTSVKFEINYGEGKVRDLCG